MTFPFVSAIGAQLAPETIIHFQQGTWACLTKEDLTQLLAMAIKGEKTKANAMAIQNGGECIFIPPRMKVRVISVDYGAPDAGIGFLEIIDEHSKSGNGVWAYSIGAVSTIP